MSRFTPATHPQYTDAQREELNRRFEYEIRRIESAVGVLVPGLRQDEALMRRAAECMKADFDAELAVAAADREAAGELDPATELPGDAEYDAEEEQLLAAAAEPPLFTIGESYEDTLDLPEGWSDAPRPAISEDIPEAEMQEVIDEWERVKEPILRSMRGEVETEGDVPAPNACARCRSLYGHAPQPEATTHHPECPYRA